MLSSTSAFVALVFIYKCQLQVTLRYCKMSRDRRGEREWYLHFNRHCNQMSERINYFHISTLTREMCVLLLIDQMQLNHSYRSTFHSTSTLVNTLDAFTMSQELMRAHRQNALLRSSIVAVQAASECMECETHITSSIAKTTNTLEQEKERSHTERMGLNCRVLPLTDGLLLHCSPPGTWKYSV